jgi:CTP:phosphocholine cytidylyltransferase-like protein
MIFRRRFYFKLSIFSLLVVFVACSRLPNVQGNGEALLQGVWNQDSVANAAQLLNYTAHKFKFSCDSFYVDLTTHSKVNYYEEACFNKGVWKEYAKGTYVVKGDTLFLKGTFTKANYKQKVSGCYRNGQYLNNFKIKSATATSLSLVGLNDHKEVVMALKEKINCVPKQL